MSLAALVLGPTGHRDGVIHQSHGRITNTPARHLLPAAPGPHCTRYRFIKQGEGSKDG